MVNKTTTPKKATPTPKAAEAPKVSTPKVSAPKAAKVVKLIAIKNKLTNGVTMDMYVTTAPTIASEGLGNWEKAQIKAGLLRVVED